MIQFGSDAIVRAECSSRTASVAFLEPTSLSTGDGMPVNASIRAFVRHLPMSCAESRIDEPCIAHHVAYPALFYCSYVGSGGTFIIPTPVKALGVFLP